MKKLCLLSFILQIFFPVFGKESHFNFELKSSGNFYFSANEQNSFSGSGGILLNFGSIFLRGFVSVPKSEFSEISSAFKSKNFNSIFSDRRWSANSTLFKNTIPLTLAAGSISFSKSIGRLKNPVPAISSNPVQKSFPVSAGIGYSLPGISSTEKPPAFFCSLDFFKKNIPVLVQAAFRNEDRAAFFSSKTKIHFSKKVFLQSHITFSSTILENNSSYLKKNNCDFTSQRCNSFFWENFFISPFFKFNFYSCFQQNPYGINVFYFNSKVRLSAQNFILDASFFAIPTTKISPKAVPLISSDSSIIKTVEQASLNPQLVFLTNGGNLLRFGVTATETWKIAGTSEVSSINTAKIAAGFIFEKPNFSFKSNFTGGNLLISGNPPSKSSIPNKFYEILFGISKTSQAFSENFTVKGRQYPPQTENDSVKQEFSLDSSISVGKKRSIKLSGSLTSVLSNGIKDSSTYSLSAVWKIKKKHFSSSIKITFKQKN